jgi:O-antigen ligase
MAAARDTVTNRIIMLILLGYPVLLLTVKSGMNALFFLLLATSLFCLFRPHPPAAARRRDGDVIAYSIAMASPVLAVFLSQAYHGAFAAPAFDGPARFLLSIPIFLALRQTEMRALTVLQYGLPLGALGALLAVAIIPRDWQNDSNLHAFQFSNHIHFGDLALMLGFLSLFSINWGQRDRPAILILKICGLLAGLYLSEQSGARGGWLAIPVFMLIWFMARDPGKPWRRLAVASLSIVLAVSLSYFLIGAVQHRLDLIYQDLADYQHGNKDTSIGIRLQLWQAACHLFAEHPVFGVGPNGFAQMMTPLRDSGMLTAEAADLGHSEVHNEILAKSAGLGIFGLVSILSVYAVPMFIFMRAMRSSLPQARVAALMGICLVAGFFTFGLTVEIFDLKMTAAFYSLTLAVLLAAATHRSPG